MIKKIIIGLLSSVTLIFGAMGVSAAETELETMTVTAGRMEQELKDVPMSVGVVDNKTIEEGLSRTIGEMLEAIPGVDTMTGSMAGLPRVNIRGEKSDRVLVLIDGVKISDQKAMSGSPILADPNQIERVEVIKGPSSVLYGPEAIAGVVNIITKKSYYKPVGFSVKATYDSSVSAVEPSAGIHGNYNGFLYSLSASTINAGNRRVPGGTIKGSDYYRGSISGMAGYEWDNGKFTVKSDIYRSVINIPVTNMGIMAMDMKLKQWNRDSYTASLELRELTDNFVKLTVTPYYQFIKKDHRNSTSNYMAKTLAVPHSLSNQYSYGLKMQSDWIILDDHYLIAGLEYNKEELDAKTDMATYFFRTNKVKDIKTKDKAEVSSFDILVQDTWNINDNFALTGGLRQSWTNFELKKSLTEKTGKKNEQFFVGSAGIVFTEGPVAVRTNFSQGYRVASLSSLYTGAYNHGMGFTAPNKDLKSERSNNYEIGVRYVGDALFVDAAGYYAETKNLFATQSVPGTRDTQYVNLDKAFTHGFEFQTEYRFDNNVTPYFSMNIMQRKVWSKDKPTYKSGVSPFSGRSGVKYHHAFASDMVIYADAWVKWASQATQLIHGKEDVRKAYEVYNASVGLRGGENGKYHATFAVKNIFNKKYKETYSSLLSPATTYVLTAGYDF